jgi:hypothetical protein
MVGMWEPRNAYTILVATLRGKCTHDREGDVKTTLRWILGRQAVRMCGG